MAWSPNSLYSLSSGAGVLSCGPGGSWNATPPASTVASDCVLSFNPFAPIDTSTPLAFQKREERVTNLSLGPSTKICSETPLPSLSS